MDTPASSRKMTEYWSLPAHGCKYLFVDTESKFVEADHYLKSARAIALDAEWKPITTRKIVSGQQSPRVSILQIACLIGPAARRNDLISETFSFGSRSLEEPLPEGDDIITIILDMLALSPTSISESLKSILRSPNIIKLGYGLRDDMKHLAKNNCDTAARNCFDVVVPYIDIGVLFKQTRIGETEMKANASSRRMHSLRIGGGLASVAHDVLGLPLCKDLQCSNWENRPLTTGQIEYAAGDVVSLLEMFEVLCKRVVKVPAVVDTRVLEEHLSPPPPATSYSQTNHMFHPPLGFQSLLQQKQHAVGPQSSCNHIPIPSRCLTSGVVYSQVKVSAIALAIAAIASLQIRNPDSCEVVPGGNQRRGHTLDATAKGGDSSECGGVSGDQDDIEAGLRGTGPEGEAREGWGMNWSEAVEQFGFRVCLQEEVVSSKKKRHGKKSKKKRTGTNGMVGSGVSEERGRWNKDMEDSDLEWVGPAPWDKAVGGDGVPKFLCDTMIEGLARQLRCVGMDTASPIEKKSDARQLVEQAEREGRVLLTRDVKLLRKRLVPPHRALFVKSLSKQEQLKEVITTFDLKIIQSQLLSRCIRCNGEFSPLPLSAKDALSSAPWSQVLPQCALENVDEFWQCACCKHLYWEGSQFDRAFRQFASVCQPHPPQPTDPIPPPRPDSGWTREIVVADTGAIGEEVEDIDLTFHTEHGFGVIMGDGRDAISGGSETRSDGIGRGTSQRGGETSGSREGCWGKSFVCGCKKSLARKALQSE